MAKTTCSIPFLNYLSAAHHPTLNTPLLPSAFLFGMELALSECSLCAGAQPLVLIVLIRVRFKLSETTAVAPWSAFTQRKQGANWNAGFLPSWDMRPRWP